jgi:cytochrome b
VKGQAPGGRASWGVAEVRVTGRLVSGTLESSQLVVEEGGHSFSAGVSGALAGRLRLRLMEIWLAEHQAKYGVFTEAELRELAVVSGVPYLAPTCQLPQ